VSGVIAGLVVGFAGEAAGDGDEEEDGGVGAFLDAGEKGEGGRERVSGWVGGGGRGDDDDCFGLGCKDQEEEQRLSLQTRQYHRVVV